MKRRPWLEVREEFREVVSKDGAAFVARHIHAHRVTVHRIATGQTRRPSGPLRVEIERFVASATDPKDTTEK